MRQEKLNKLNEILLSLSVKDSKVIQKPHDKKFIQSVVREYTLNDGKKVIREEILKNGKAGSAVIVVPVIGKEILTVVEPRVFTKLTVAVGFPAGYIEQGEEPGLHGDDKEQKELGIGVECGVA